MLYHLQREALSSLMITATGSYAILGALLHQLPRPRRAENPTGLYPLGNTDFQNPYDDYRWLRDHAPVYRLPNGVYCISRYQDILDISRDVHTFSSQHQGVVANLQPHQNLLTEVKKFERLGRLGVIPADVLATSDPPDHTQERKVGHSCLNARYVKSLEPEVEALCQQMLAPVLARGEVEFMQEFAWRLPMMLILRLLGLPESDYEQIKQWCVQILESQNGLQHGAELAASYKMALQFLRYCWREYLKAKKKPGDNMLGILAREANRAESDFNDQKAVSAVFQLIIAGSDSSATTMGNALKLLIENKHIQQQIRQDISLLPAYIEEVFRLESAFQGHFRWTRKATRLHGVDLPRGSRVFLMWGSGNRDERFWDQPDVIKLNRKNGKKHLTFGHGIHACLGRELARTEIRIVLKAFLEQTERLQIAGETPYIASMFARTLLTLPVRFELKKPQGTSLKHYGRSKKA